MQFLRSSTGQINYSTQPHGFLTTIVKILASIFLFIHHAAQNLTNTVSQNSGNIMVSYSPGNRTFVFDVGNFTGKTSYVTGTMMTPPSVFDQYIKVGSENTGINIIAFGPTKEPRYFEINFSKSCLFPVFAIGLGESPRVGIWENSPNFQVDNAYFIGLPGFNRLNADFQPRNYPSLIDFNSAEKEEVFSQSIDLSDYRNLINTYITVFCPFFSDPLQNKFTFDLMFKRRNNAETTKIRNTNNELASLSRVFFVPYAGQHTINIPELKQNTKFVFNITTASSVNVYINYSVDGHEQQVEYFPEYAILPACKNVTISMANPLSIAAFVQMNTTYTDEPALESVVNKTGLIVGLSVGGVVILVVVILLINFRKRIFFCFHKDDYDQFEKILPSTFKSNATNYPEHINSTMVMMAQMANENNLAPNITDKIFLRLNFDQKIVSESNFLSPMTNLVVSNRALGDTESGPMVESLRTNVTYDIYPKLETEAPDDKNINHKLFSESSINTPGSHQHLRLSHIGHRLNEELEEGDHNIPIMRLKLPRSIEDMAVESTKKLVTVDKVIIETAPQLEESLTEDSLPDSEKTKKRIEPQTPSAMKKNKVDGKVIPQPSDKEVENSIAFIEEHGGCMPRTCK